MASHNCMLFVHYLATKNFRTKPSRPAGQLTVWRPLTQGQTTSTQSAKAMFLKERNDFDIHMCALAEMHTCTCKSEHTWCMFCLNSSFTLFTRSRTRTIVTLISISPFLHWLTIFSVTVRMKDVLRLFQFIFLLKQSPSFLHFWLWG